MHRGAGVGSQRLRGRSPSVSCVSQSRVQPLDGLGRHPASQDAHRRQHLADRIGEAGPVTRVKTCLLLGKYKTTTPRSKKKILRDKSARSRYPEVDKSLVVSRR